MASPPDEHWPSRDAIGKCGGSPLVTYCRAQERGTRASPPEPGVTYCLGIWSRHGLVMASDSRTNAGHDQVNVASKMHTFVQPGERVFVLLSSGSLSCTQSIITLLRRDFDQGKGLAQAPSLYDAARVIGEQVRRVADLDRAALERDDFKFNANLILGGQVRGEAPGLFIIYPQGNPLQASEASP